MNTSTRQEILVENNVRLLLQGMSLLDRLDDETYAEVGAAVAPHRVGGHVRHILEFYECFLDGLETGRIDYDARKRDQALETRTAAAAAKMRHISARLLQSRMVRTDGPVLVRMEDAPASPRVDTLLKSSIGRELQVLASHTVHHYALIALTLRALGVAVDLDFGMAPSTLRYLASKRETREVAQCAR